MVFIENSWDSVRLASLTCFWRVFDLFLSIFGGRTTEMLSLANLWRIFRFNFDRHASEVCQTPISVIFRRFPIVLYVWRPFDAFFGRENVKTRSVGFSRCLLFRNWNGWHSVRAFSCQTQKQCWAWCTFDAFQIGLRLARAKGAPVSYFGLLMVK